MEALALQPLLVVELVRGGAQVVLAVVGRRRIVGLLGSFIAGGILSSTWTHVTPSGGWGAQ